MTASPPYRTILLVDDDPPIRQLVRRALEERGFVLLEARNGEEALQLAGERRSPIDLLMTDIVLPHMDGFTLSRRFAVLHPDTKVLFMSGYAGDSVAVRVGLKESGQHFLLKPFTKDQLNQKITAVLESPAAGSTSPKTGANH